MRVTVSTQLDCSAERAWEEVRRPQLLWFIAWPIVTYKPEKPHEIPGQWQPGRFLVSMRLFGLLPLGKQTIHISIPEQNEAESHYRLRDNGAGQLIRQWDHMIEISRLDDNHARYEDRVDIEAGLLTPFIWVFASLFYRWRQKRWRALVRKGFEQLSA